MFKLSALSVFVVGFALLAMPADAGWRRHKPEGRVVTAHSDFGNGTVSGRVRWTSVGRQVQLPGGNWIHCARSCAETLRVQTVDFWESVHGKGSGDASTSEHHLFGPLRFNFRY
ncbi:MAG: hypothetical protein ACR2PA_16315 [Hyphomicrobiaceae bacterium]